MKAAWLFILGGVAAACTYPWALKFRGSFFIEPEAQKHHLYLYASVRYLLFHQTKQVHCRWRDAELLDHLVQWRDDEKIKHFYTNFDFQSFWRRFRGAFFRFRVKKCQWDTTAGNGNAAHTALICVLLWNIKKIVLMKIQKNFPAFPAEINVLPSYRHIQLKTHFECIICLNLIQIISIAGFFLLSGRLRNLMPKKWKKN